MNGTHQQVPPNVVPRTATPVRFTRADRRRISAARATEIEARATREQIDAERQRLDFDRERALYARPVPPSAPGTGRRAPDHEETTRRIKGKGVVWAISGLAAFVIGLVIILTQVGFYSAHMHNRDVNAFGWVTVNLAYFTPFAVEALGWVCTTLAAFATINDRPSAKYARFMWLFSSIAALVNSIDNIRSNDPLTGVVLGGLSLGVPLVVHLTMRWARDSDSGRTTDQFRDEFRRRVAMYLQHAAQFAVHPLTTVRAIHIATDFHLGWAAAYRVALLRRRGDVKGVLNNQFTDALNSGTLIARPAEVALPALFEQSAGSPLIALDRSSASVVVPSQTRGDEPAQDGEDTDSVTTELLLGMTGKEALDYALHVLFRPPFVKEEMLRPALVWLSRNGKALDRSNANKYWDAIDREQQPQPSGR